MINNTTITRDEINTSWVIYWDVIYFWGLHSFGAFISTAVIWDFISKNYLGSKVWYASMNDTEDGDFGSEKWRKEKGYKKNWWAAFNWWFRNICWNYISQFNPPWYAGEVQEFLTITDTLTSKDEYGRFTRADKTKGIYGTHHIAYRIDGQVYTQWSHANKVFHLQIGTGGSEYRFRMKWF